SFKDGDGNGVSNKSLNLVVPENEYLEHLPVVFLENIESTE
ncbi:hypothetical protein Tco_1488078, partial [Tanacetum coccineum]